MPLDTSAPPIFRCRGPVVCTSAQNRWCSPVLPVEPGHFFKATFEARTRRDAYWAVFFDDGDGNEFRADHYTGIASGWRWRRQEVHFQSFVGVRGIRLAARPRRGARLEVRHVELTASSPAAAAAWGDRLLADMAPIPCRPPVDRLRLLPQTAERLAAGATVRLLITGDSVANDLANSLFIPFLCRDYPGVEIDLIEVIRTGEEARFALMDAQTELASRNPDLVLFAGLSCAGQAHSLQRLIRELRAHSGAEIAIAEPAPPVANDPKDPANPHPCNTHTGPAVRRQLAAVAAAEHAEHIPLTEAWLDYARRMPQAYRFLMRDTHHINSYGGALLGRLVADHFHPQR